MTTKQKETQYRVIELHLEEELALFIDRAILELPQEVLKACPHELLLNNTLNTAIASGLCNYFSSSPVLSLLIGAAAIQHRDRAFALYIDTVEKHQQKKGATK